MLRVPDLTAAVVMLLPVRPHTITTPSLGHRHRTAERVNAMTVVAPQKTQMPTTSRENLRHPGQIEVMGAA